MGLWLFPGKITALILFFNMNEQLQKDNPLAPVAVKLINIIIMLLIFIVGLIIVMIAFIPDSIPSATNKAAIPVPDQYGNFTDAAKAEALKPKDTTNYWLAPDLSTSDHNKELIAYGKDLIVHTSLYYGENGKVFKAGTNGMNCQNCHLDAGTKTFGNNYSAVASTYPKYRARSGSVENIYKRVNDCFERSLNGNALDTTSKEMLAITAYIKWLGTNVKKGEKPAGSGFKDITLLDRPADPEKGKIIYIEKCQSCHQSNGAGLINSEQTEFTYPPLWGEKSYNDGAGLFRLSNFAKFVKYNMPLGVAYNSAQLSDEEAWDVAAFVNSQNRPHKHTKQDWSKIAEKPFDHPFGPYADNYSEAQHKFGPFKPIKEKPNKLNKK
jgi:thiosulfate dehydrogenase